MIMKWQIKALIQSSLSIIPMGECFNYYLQKKNKSFDKNLLKNRVKEFILEIDKINQLKIIDNSIIMEIGTGWQPISAVIFCLYGAKEYHTYDIKNHLRLPQVIDILNEINENFHEFSKYINIDLEKVEQRLKVISGITDLNDLLKLSNIIYHAPADASDSGLYNNSVDIIFSHAVLEHIDKGSIIKIVKESKRILKSDGIFYHFIDMRDHYSSFDKNITPFNFLKYSRFGWETFYCNKMNYQNRLREKEYIDIFTGINAEIINTCPQIDKSDIDIIKQMKINNEFVGMSYEELSVKWSSIIGKFNK
jgi:SAM-dependent methyltransferase